MGYIKSFKSTLLIAVYLVMISLLTPLANAYISKDKSIQTPSANAYINKGNSEHALKAKREAMLRGYIEKNPKPQGEPQSSIGLCPEVKQHVLYAKTDVYCCFNKSSYWCRVGAAMLNTLDHAN
jgi:hypothetical protein